MKLVLTKDFNKEFFNSNELKCHISKYAFLSDSADLKIQTAYENDDLSLLTYKDLLSCKFWSTYGHDLVHEPALEYSTDNSYNFYSYRLRIDPSMPDVIANKNSKLRCICLLSGYVLMGIIYFDGEGDTLSNETSEGVTIQDYAQEISISLTIDESDNVSVSGSNIDDIIANSYLETPDLVRYTGDTSLKLRITYDKDDNDPAYMMLVADNDLKFNVAPAPLMLTRYQYNFAQKPFMSLSTPHNTVYVDDRIKNVVGENPWRSDFRMYMTEYNDESFNIFSDNVTSAVGTFDLNSKNTVHKNDLTGDYTDITINSTNVTSTITGYGEYCESNAIVNCRNSNFVSDGGAFINASNVTGNTATDFALGNSTFINTDGVYYNNNENVRSEMNLTLIGTTNVSSYNKSTYDWANSDNSVLMLGNNVSSVNINGCSNYFIGFSGLASNTKNNGYLIGSFNDPSVASLLTISTGWYDKSKSPRVFNMERDYFYAVDKPWISRNNLMNIFDDKDIDYTYFAHGERFTGTIEDATCIQLGKDLFITPTDIIAKMQKMQISDIINMKNVTTDIFQGESFDTNTIDDMNQKIDSINAFAIHLKPSDFEGSSPSMPLSTLISKVETQNSVSFKEDVIYTIYVIMENDLGNDRWILDGNNKKKYINNGDAFACTCVLVLNNEIL